MNTDINQRKHRVNVSREVPINPDFDLHMLEAFLNDRIENEILRMMEYCGEKSTYRTTLLPPMNANPF